MERVLFYAAGLPVYLYGFMIAVGLFFSTMLLLREGRRKGLGGHRMFDFALGASASFLVGARVFSGLQHYGLGMLARPWLVLTHQLGLHQTAGIACAIFFGFLFAYYHNLLLSVFLDAVAPSVALLAAFAALGSNVFGAETDLPWAVVFGNLELHPLPLYTGLGYYAVFSLLWRSRKHIRFDGQLALGFVVGAAWLHVLLMPVRQMEHRDPLVFWGLLILAVPASVLWVKLYSEGRMAMLYRRRSRGVLQLFADLLVFLVVALAMTTMFYLRVV